LLKLGLHLEFLFLHICDFLLEINDSFAAGGLIPIVLAGGKVVVAVGVGRRTLGVVG
jgi:hypothetical protein